MASGSQEAGNPDPNVAPSAASPLGASRDGSPATFVVSPRRTIVDLLGAAVNVVGSASGPTPEVIEAARAGAILLVDASLDPQDRNLAACIVRCRAGGTPVAVLFCDGDELAQARWVELGASAVQTLDVSLSAIRDLLTRLARNETVLGVSVREGLLSKLRDQRQVESERTAVFASLTKREAQVLRALALGAAPEEVARTSFVSLNTVRTQIRGVLAKLGVTSVVAAVALGYRTGWIAPDLQ